MRQIGALKSEDINLYRNRQIHAISKIYFKGTGDSDQLTFNIGIQAIQLVLIF